MTLSELIESRQTDKRPDPFAFWVPELKRSQIEEEESELLNILVEKGIAKVIRTNTFPAEKNAALYNYTLYRLVGR